MTLQNDEICILSYDKILWKGNISINENSYQAIIRQVQITCRENYDFIINKQCVKVLIDCLNEDYPGVTDGLVPEKISYLQLKKNLQEIVKAKGNIRDLIHILEEMEESYSTKS